MELLNQAFYSARVQATLRRVLGVYWPPVVPERSLADQLGEPHLGAPVPDAPDEAFEVNMMECLTGWKGWVISRGRLCSPAYHREWSPDEPFRAACGSTGHTCVVTPSMAHSCGIYAADSVDAVRNYGSITGEVWGWGRYIRGDKGWRAEFIYPKNFYLRHGQAELIDVLRPYHVPIFIDEPLRVYDPSEEGYVLEEGYGYGNAEANGRGRAFEAAHTSEEGDFGTEAEQG